MAASQAQREEQKEKKQSVRLDPLQGASKQVSPSESPVESTANGHQNRSQAVADRAPATYPTTPSYSYYYPGYDASVGGDFYNQGYYVAGNTIDSQYPVVQTDGSIVYMMPGVFSGYDPYTSYMPVSPISVDGQYLSQQMYPSSPVFQSPEYSLASLPNGDLVQTPYFWNTSNILVGDPGLGNGFVGVLGTTPSKPNYSSATVSTNVAAKPSKLSNPSNLSLEVISRSEKKQKPFNKASSHVSSFQSDLAPQGYYGVAKFPYHNQGSSALLYSNNLVASKSNAKGWVGPEKPKARSNLVDNAKMVNEKSHGLVTLNVNDSGVNSAESKSSGDDKGGAEITSQVTRGQYNLAEFSTKYDHALFFVIKSYSEDDIHKSIKYNVWASTPNGNKRLSIAFQEAQDMMAETGTECPIFLFFSVNASGQFCGVAEMTGQVDFSKSMDFWQQSKWNGYFPVKWHIIKDIPNSQLRHVILHNNENKPVTNSRDTQEVKFHQGMDVLSVFKNYTSATSILDDFDFYENRQKIMQEKRLRQSVDLQVKVDEVSTGIEAVELSTVKKG